jgi:TrmH RNA methyltransferase
VQRLIWLDGVGNPHNLGAVLRSAAHFGAAAVLLPEDSTLGLSSAAVRVAEGGAEVVPLLRLDDSAAAIAMLHDAGFVLCATLPRAMALICMPKRCLIAPSSCSAPKPRACAIKPSATATAVCRFPAQARSKVSNIANAVGVVLAEHWRQTMG